MRLARWTETAWPAMLGAAWLASLFGSLLSPSRALATRDIAIFHLPLRASFRELTAFGLPVWNPWLHGGQPVLSNPSYGAFYPPSWLVLLVPPANALSLMAVLHAAVAFAGAWRLARHFGCGRGAAALAGVGYIGCGAYLSLLSAYTLFGSMSWFPWVLAWGDESLRMPEGERWWRPALLAGGALGLQILNGEPSTVVISGLALLALATSAIGRKWTTAPRVLVPILFAVALAAIQLLPTLGRLPDSPRRGLPAAMAMTWSMPPARLAEIVLPRFFGDPQRMVEGLYFGWKINDNGAYVESLYPGLLLVVLGAAALLGGRIPRRQAWVLALTASSFLALGRHNPLYTVLRNVIPGLAVLRFPEKFVILAVFSLSVAGVLGWQRLLDERDAGHPEAANLPLAVGLLALTAALSWTALLGVPSLAARFVVLHGLPGMPEAGRALALEYLREESWTAVRTAAAVALFLGLCRWERPPRRLLEIAAVLLLAADLWHYGHASVQTLPAAAYSTPPPLAESLLPAEDRLFVEVPSGTSHLFRRWGDPRTLFTRSYLLGLRPYSGALWRIPGCFEPDFELMLTGWGRSASDILRSEAAHPERLYRYLGVWNVGTLLLQRNDREQEAALRDPAVPPLREVTNPYVLPRFRLVPEVTFHASHASALSAARAQGWDVARSEHCVRPGLPSTHRSRLRPELLEVTQQGGRVDVRYRAREAAFFVAAMTYDKGWRASADGQPLGTHPTAAGQLGVSLPPGEHRLVLHFREPLVGAGAAVSLLALAVGAGALLGRRR